MCSSAGRAIMSSTAGLAATRSTIRWPRPACRSIFRPAWPTTISAEQRSVGISSRTSRRSRAAAATSVSFYFSTRMAYNNFGGPTVGVDQFSSIEAFKGGSGNDVFVGGPGNHGVDGGPGLDTLDYSAATTSVSFYFSTGLAYNN